MTPRTSCPHEADVLDLVAIGQWPARADAALTEHVASCEICSDVAVVATAMADLGEASMAAVRVPDASAVWYRAQVAAREELARRATRPVLAAEIAAALGALGVLILTWHIGGDVFRQWWNQFAGLSIELPLSRAAAWLPTTSPTWRWIAIGFAVWVVLIPAVFYVAYFVDRLGEPSPDRHTRV
jgi:hypothetical protein